MASCTTDDDCGFGTCAASGCYCLDVFVSGDRCQGMSLVADCGQRTRRTNSKTTNEPTDHILTHPIVYAYLSLSLVYFLAVCLRIAKLIQFQRRRGKGGNERLSDLLPPVPVLCVALFVVCGWTAWLVSRFFMWEERLARTSRSLGMLGSSLSLPLITTFGSRVAVVMNKLKDVTSPNSECGDRFWIMFKHLHWFLVWPITLIKVTFLLPIASWRSYENYFVFDAATAVLGLLLFQLPVSVPLASPTFLALDFPSMLTCILLRQIYGHYLIRILSNFPEKNARTIARIKHVSYYMAAATVVVLIQVSINTVLRPLWADLGVVGSCLFDIPRLAGLPFFASLLSDFVKQGEYSWLHCRVYERVQPMARSSSADTMEPEIKPSPEASEFVA